MLAPPHDVVPGSTDDDYYRATLKPALETHQ
jgi:hypothetical protein